MNNNMKDNNHEEYYEYKSNLNNKSKRNKDLNYIDRFLYKFIIGLVLLTGLFILDKFEYISVDKLKNELNGNINALEVVNLINGNLNIIDLGTEEETQVSTSLDGEFIDDKMKVVTNNFYGVKCVICGVVTKIIRNNGYIEVTILGIDNVNYVYSHLQSIDVNIYEYVKTNTIIGNTDSYYEVTRSNNN